MCILDVSKHMGSGSSGGDTHLQSAKAAIEMFVQQKVGRVADSSLLSFEVCHCLHPLLPTAAGPLPA